MHARWMGTLVAVALTAAACGKSEEQKQAEAAAAQAQAAAADAQKQAAAATAQAADATKQAQQDVAKGVEAMTQAMQQAAGAAGATGSMQPVDPVSFHDLEALFPDLDGWTKGKPRGERMTAPFPYSQAEVNYEKGDARIDLKIVDSGNHQLLLAPYTMFLAAGYEKESDNGYEKSTKIGGEPGWEKWDSESKHGELNAVVGKRFLVTTSGNNIADNKVLQDVLARTDLTKLAGLK